MRKILVVAVREYTAAVHTKAFLISLLLMPIMMGGSVVIQLLMKDRVDIGDKKFAVVDHTGTLFDAIEAAAIMRNADGIFKEEAEEGESRKQVKPRFLVEEIEPDTTDPAQLRFELSNRVRDGEFLAFVVIGKDVVNPPDPEDPGSKTADTSVAYYSNSPTYDDFQNWVAGPINEEIQQRRLAEVHLDPEVVAKAIKGTPVANLGLVERDVAGNITEAKETNMAANILVPLGMMMLMFMVIMVGASPLVQSVLEEKMNRVAEVLLGSIPPFQLMLGKLIGMVGVSMTIGTLYLVGAFIAVSRAGQGAFFPSHIVIWFMVYLALAVLMYGSVFIAIGAAVSDLKESQSLMTPVMLVVVSPMFVWLNVVREPTSTLSLVLSLFPPATPMLMTLRQSVPPGVPAWQPALGITLVLLTTIVCVFAAGRIFRIGILMQGKGAKVSELLRWVVRG